MALQYIKADTAEHLTRAINGLVVGKTGLIRGRDQSPTPAVAPNNLYKHPVNGLTLIFTAPVGVVTFVGDRNYKEIIADIEAVVAGVPHLWKIDANGGMVLALWHDTTPVTLSDAGTANDYFGFSTTPADPALVQTPIPPANIVSINVEPLSRQYVCFYT